MSVDRNIHTIAIAYSDWHIQFCWATYCSNSTAVCYIAPITEKAICLSALGPYFEIQLKHHPHSWLPQAFSPQTVRSKGKWARERTLVENSSAFSVSLTLGSCSNTSIPLNKLQKFSLVTWALPLTHLESGLRSLIPEKQFPEGFGLGTSKFIIVPRDNLHLCVWPEEGIWKVISSRPFQLSQCVSYSHLQLQITE